MDAQSILEKTAHGESHLLALKALQYGLSKSFLSTCNRLWREADIRFLIR
jgi:hypothetical protein